VRVALIKGGRSLERAVSLRSGARVEDALVGLGHELVVLDADEELVRALKAEQPEVAFIALHGPGGEDGTVQELLEILRIPYTGPGVAACMRSMDKVATKQILRERGIPTPTGRRSTRPPSASSVPPMPSRRSRRASASRW
jgi:D-alanine-D-alanine ligase